MYDGTTDHWFEYNGERLPAFYHLYNLTHLNERAVEVAIARRWIEALGDGRGDGLEVGNVLGHYWRCAHAVVDLHEPQPWYQKHQQYMNVDLFELLGNAHVAGWLVSLSTVEHTADPAAAVSLLRGLAPRGLVTFPTGVDPALDDWVEEGLPGPYRACTLARVQNDHGGWAQTPLPQARPYGPWANAVAVLEWGEP
jgi:hypothetical protein